MSPETSVAPTAAAKVARATADRQAPPANLVIFGGGGDLTKRLVVPALYNLVRARRLPDGFSIVGVGRGEEDTSSWRHNLRQMMEALIAHGGGEFRAAGIDQTAWDWLQHRMTFVQGDFTQPEIYGKLKSWLAQQSTTQRNGNVLFYLAVADKFFGPIIEHLGRAELTRQSNGGWRRVDHRKAVRARPRLGARPQRADPENSGGRPDLSDRSFPWQGNCPEHPGAAI